MTHNLTTSAQHSNALDDTPRIYVACLAAYNNGKLHGTWIAATLEPDAIMDEVRAMLDTSPEPDAEEWAIHCYENFHGFPLSEWEGFIEVHAYATFIAEHGRLGADLIAYTGDIEHARAMMSDGYAGCFESLADFAEELTEDITTIPQHLTCYIDYERMADDMEGTGHILTIKTAHDEVHIFWNR